MDDLHNLNDLLAEIEGLSLRTTQGSFVKVEDVRRLVEKRQAARAVDSETEFKGKTFNAAHQAIKKDPAFASLTENKLREPGRSVPATEPQPPSRA